MKGDIPEVAFKILTSGVPVRTHSRDFSANRFFDYKEYMKTYNRERKLRARLEKRKA